MILAQIKAYIMPVMLSALVGLFMLWRGAVHDGEQAKELARIQIQFAAAQSRISAYEEQLDRTSQTVIQRVLETPNANVIVPSDVADAWFDGIDSLRNSETSTDKGHDELSGPGSGDAGKGRTDKWSVSSDLTAAGSSISKV